MSGVLSLTTLLVIYAGSEAIARRTHAIIDTVLSISIIALIGFWTGILPKNLFSISGIDHFGMAVVGLMLTALGTSIDLAELKRESKVVVVAIAGAFGSSVLIVIVAALLGRINYGIVGAPIFAGGNAATLVLLSALKVHHYALLSTYALAVLTFQNIIGIPVATCALRKEAKYLIVSDELEKSSMENEKSEESGRKPLQLPDRFNTPIFCLAKLGLVASLSYGVSLLLHGAINYLVLCFVFGIIFYQLGFLDQGISEKTSSNGIITFLVTIVILASLASTTPQQVITVLLPLLTCLLVGTCGVILTSALLSRICHISLPLAIALGMTCTFGFPTTMIMSQEVAASIGRNERERLQLQSYLLPKMLTAGLVTVTLISVFFAGFAINYLH